MFEQLRENAEKVFSVFEDKRIAKMITDCFFNTLDTTCSFEDDGSVFVLTGDIPAMWLRDSSAQVMQYLYFAEDEDVRKLIKGVLKRQFRMITLDPYANAFLKDETEKSIWAKKVVSDKMPPMVWERKFELDSLCYPLFLLIKYYEKTGDKTPFDNTFFEAFDHITDTFAIEENHSKNSKYFFKRKFRRERTEKPSGKNQKFDIGLIWSGFRPSDDLCKYHYHLPDNMFAVTVMTRLGAILRDFGEVARSELALAYGEKIRKGIEKYGIKEVADIGKVYVAETDCMGKFSFDDDANIPSLLSIPYLEYPYMDKEIYENTRKYVLSKRNKYYYEGSILQGIGSPHTPGKRVWHLAVTMQGLTATNEEEKKKCFDMLVNSDGERGLMHESVNADNDKDFSRPWFAWANSLFAEFVLQNLRLLKQ